MGNLWHGAPRLFTPAVCDFLFTPVACDRCGMPFVVTPNAPLHCMPEGDHACCWCVVRQAPPPNAVHRVGGEDTFEVAIPFVLRAPFEAWLRRRGLIMVVTSESV